MSSTTAEPISIADARARRAQRPVMNAGQSKAYRRLALTILGLDVETLTSELRARREQRLISDAPRAA